MSLYSLLLPLLGLLTGVSLGALGSGGSILALPAFVYAAHLPVKSAVATSLAVVGATSLIGAVLARYRCETHGCPGQEVDGRVAVLFTAGGLAGSFAGARLAGLLPGGVQMILFAGVLLGAAAAMLRRRSEPDVETPTTGGAPAPARLVWIVPALGLVVGLLTGLVGVGGGFLIVPALTLLAGVPVKRAAATSLWIIAANSATGLLGYLGQVPVAWGTAGVFLVTAVAGMAAGQRVARTAPPRRLQTAFAVFLLIVGVFTIAKTVLK